MSEHHDENSRRIDVWGAVLRIWQFKWVWLAVFALITVAGAAYSLTRPATSSATQLVSLELRTTDSEAVATQQTAMLSPMALRYVEYATIPPFTDAFVAKHPELNTPDEVKGAVSVQLRNVSLLAFTASGADGQKQATLARDLADAFVASVNAEKSPAMGMTAAIHGDAVISPNSSGKALTLATSVLGGAAIATVVAAILGSRRRATQPVA